MDKAAKIVKRSSARLRSLGSGHGDLSVCISEQRDVKNAAKTFITAQQSASDYQLRWAGSGENQALHDVTNQVWELNSHWAEIQGQFTDCLRDYQRMFELMLEGERAVDLEKAQLSSIQDKYTKVQKEYNKNIKKGMSCDELTQKLTELEKQRNSLENQVSKQNSENEAVKMIRFKQGLIKLSEAYITLGSQCKVIFEAQKQLAGLLPDVTDKPIGELKYSGAIHAREIVQKTKEETTIDTPKTERKRRSSQGKRRYSNQKEVCDQDKCMGDEQTEVKKRDSGQNGHEIPDLPPPYSPSPRTSIEPSPSYHHQSSTTEHRRRTFPLSVAPDSSSNRREPPFNPRYPTENPNYTHTDDPEGVGCNIPFTGEDNQENRIQSNLYPNLDELFPNERKSMPVHFVEVNNHTSTKVGLRKENKIKGPRKNTFV